MKTVKGPDITSIPFRVANLSPEGASCCAEMSGCVSQEICDIGYSPHDIITTFFRVVKLSPELPEFLKLEFIRVSTPVLLCRQDCPCLTQHRHSGGSSRGAKLLQLRFVRWGAFARLQRAAPAGKEGACTIPRIAPLCYASLLCLTYKQLLTLQHTFMPQNMAQSMDILGGLPFWASVYRMLMPAACRMP